MKNLKVAALALLVTAGLAGCDGDTPKAPTLLGVELNTEEVQKAFTKGAEFSSEGLKVVAKYSDGSTTEISEFTVTAPDMATVGENKEVTVSYTLDGEAKELTYQIDVCYWSDAELTTYNNASILSYAADLPYVPGMTLVVGR